MEKLSVSFNSFALFSSFNDGSLGFGGLYNLILAGNGYFIERAWSSSEFLHSEEEGGLAVRGMKHACCTHH